MLPSPNFDAAPVSLPAPKISHVRPDEKHKSHLGFDCKFCREDFGSQSELIAHRKAHERCPYDDCRFNASEKVVAEHIQRAHLKSNALVKIQDLSTPEHIERWKNERRRRYPTTANAMLRQQAKEERLKRGERLEDKRPIFGDNRQRNQFSKHNNQRRDNQNNYGGNRNQNKLGRFNGRQKPERASDDGEPPKSDELDVAPKSRIGAHQEKSTEAASSSKSVPLRKPQENRRNCKPVDDDESSEDEKRATPLFTGTVHMKNYHSVEIAVKEQKALSVLGMYGSDSESEQSDDEAHPEPVVVTPPQIEINDDKTEDIDPSKAAQLEKAVETDDEMPEEIPIEHKIDPRPQLEPEKLETSSRKRKFDHQQTRRDARLRPRRYGLDYSKLHKPSVNHFLENLLKEDIRHERNVLLQCVSYIVKNNFFDHPAKAPKLEPATETTPAELESQRLEE